MKAYTDIEQSKRLAEILPKESADMWWAERYVGYVDESGHYIVEENPLYHISLVKPSDNNYSQDTINDIPCWSLSALLEIIPLACLDKFFNMETKSIRWNCMSFPENHSSVETNNYDNPIDAAVEMIVNLHEQKLL